MRSTFPAAASAAAIAFLLSSGSANASYSASSATDAANAQALNNLETKLEADESEMQTVEQRQTTDEATMASMQSQMSGWWDNTSISGRMYWDITNINNSNNGTKSTINGASFDIKRFYIGIDHKFDNTFSANITTDVDYQSSLGQTAIFIKYAYLQAKLNDMLIVRVGSAGLPWMPYAEDVYGYRFVEKTLIDRVNFGQTTDWGVHALGSFWDGLLAYQFSAVAGSGYKKPLRSKQPDVEGRVSLNWQGVQLGVGAYNGTEGATDNSTAIHHKFSRVDAVAAYTWQGIHVGFEYFWAHNHGFETSPLASNTDGYGYSPFASYAPPFLPQWSIFGRYDYVHPFSDTAAHNAFHNTYYNVGINYEPVKIVDFALVYKHDAGQNGNIADANGTIGGTAFGIGNNGAYNEIGIFGQLRW